MWTMLALFSVAFGSDGLAPTVVLHQGRDTAVFDAKRVHVAQEAGAHHVTTPWGRLAQAGVEPGVQPAPGQTWVLNNDVTVQVVAADKNLLEFAVVP